LSTFALSPVVECSRTQPQGRNRGAPAPHYGEAENRRLIPLLAIEGLHGEFLPVNSSAHDSVPSRRGEPASQDRLAGPSKGRVQLMKIFTASILFCMLVAVAGFAQQGSAQPAQMPQTSGAASQNPQHPGATPPYVPPQPQPETANNPKAQPPQTEPAQTPSTHTGTPGMEDQVSAQTSALN